MIEIITAIALLCQVNPTSVTLPDFHPTDVDKYQLACQQEYLKCMGNYWGEDYLAKCILQRKVK